MFYLFICFVQPQVYEINFYFNNPKTSLGNISDSQAIDRSSVGALSSEWGWVVFNWNKVLSD